MEVRGLGKDRRVLAEGDVNSYPSMHCFHGHEVSINEHVG